MLPELTRYCDDGSIEIDNSAAERALRGVALGRRNFVVLSRCRIKRGTVPIDTTGRFSSRLHDLGQARPCAVA